MAHIKYFLLSSLSTDITSFVSTSAHAKTQTCFFNKKPFSDYSCLMHFGLIQKRVCSFLLVFNSKNKNWVETEERLTFQSCINRDAFKYQNTFFYLQIFPWYYSSIFGNLHNQCYCRRSGTFRLYIVFLQIVRPCYIRMLGFCHHPWNCKTHY